MGSIATKTIEISKADLASSTFIDGRITVDTLSEQDMVLEIDRFGLSANNITYAALGDKMGYWGFFPASSSERGIVPLWGFATVVHSSLAEFPVGTRVYGYLPMSTHIVVRPGKVTAATFSDAHPQRKSISPVYDQYLNVGFDPGYNQNREVWQTNFRPLFMTSFVLAEYINQLAQGENVILTSSSSKTAVGTAAVLQSLKASGNIGEVIGLTSNKNVELTASFGLYDRVIGYDDIDTELTSNPSRILDFAANGEVLSKVNAVLKEQRLFTHLIGATDWSAIEKPSMKAERTSIFFAPDEVRTFNKEWGQDVFLQKYATAWSQFFAKIENDFTVEEIQGIESVDKAFKKVLSGELPTSTLIDARF